jgi:hypothetical protein
MSFASTRRAACSVITFASLLSAGGCVCQQEGCESVESLRVTIPHSASELEGGRLVVCRNDACFAGALAVADIDWSDLSHPERDVEVQPVEAEADASGGSATCLLSRAGEGFSLLFEWDAPSQADVQPGDVLRVTIEAADGSQLFSRDAKVTSVDENYPNGEECDDTPCRSAALTG